jgi:hypothetical protein
MQESQVRGEEFFEVFQTPGELSELELQQRIRSLRGASESLLTRAEKLDVPDQMRDAQSATTLSLRLRRDALDQIGNSITAATADAETSDAIETITTQMGSLYASDILWQQVATPEVTDVLDGEGIESQDLPTGNFMPENNPTEFLDQTEISSLLTGVSGSDSETGLQGLGLVQTAIGETSLDPDATTEVPSDASEIGVEVQNQGESEETGVTVIVTINGQELEGTLEKLGPGESDVVRVPLTTKPQPGAEAEVNVLVQPVSGESVTDNNEATYTVIFAA